MSSRKLPPLDARAHLHSGLSGEVWIIDGRRVTVLGAALDARDQIEVLVVDHANRSWRILPLVDFLKGERLPLERPLGAGEAGLHAFLESWSAPPAPIHRAFAGALTAAQEKLLRALAVKLGDEINGERPPERVLLADVEPEDDQAARALADNGLFEIHETTDFRSGRPRVSSITVTGFGWKVMRALIERPLSASEAALQAFREAWSTPPEPVHRAIAENLAAPQEKLLRALALRFGDKLNGERQREPVLSMDIEPEDDQPARALASHGIFALHETASFRNEKPIISSVTFTAFGCKVARALLGRHPHRGADG
jgi:hypothetical protein